MISIKQLLKRIFYFPVSPEFTRRLFHVDSEPVSPVNSPKSILLVCLDEIGDMVLKSPFIRELRNNYPKATITLIVKKGIENLFELCPYCDNLLTFDHKAPRFVRPFILHIRAYRLAKENLWKAAFDWAIIPRWDIDNYHATFLAYFSKARRRVAFSETVNKLKAYSNKGYDTLLTEPIHRSIVSHEVPTMLGILCYLGASISSDTLELWISEEDRKYAIDLLPDDLMRPIVAIAPGALHSNREWPVDRYRELSKWLVQTFHARLIILGGINDRELAQIIVNGTPEESIVDMTGKTTLRQTAALLERCSLYVGNDTGVKHMAAAMGVKVIEISRFPQCGDPMHQNSPVRFHAWGVDNIVLQPKVPMPPCDDKCIRKEAHCILGVKLETAQYAVVKILSDEKIGGGIE